MRRVVASGLTFGDGDVQETAAETSDAGQTDHLTMVRRIRERVDALLRLAQLEV